MRRFAPPAAPDVRFFVKQPPAETFNALIEDLNTAFAVGAIVPALFLFEGPEGRIDGQFTQTRNFGAFDVDLIINGRTVANAKGGPVVTVKEP